MKASKAVKMTEEARRAIRRNPPSDLQLKRWLNSTWEQELSQEQIRWVGYFLLALRGYEFEPDKKKCWCKK
jgi:hypothetical protein